MMLSIVTTLYRSAASIDEFYHRAVAVAEQVAASVEVVMVNDGSPDDSLQRALALQTRDARVVVVDLARNFGHHKAMMTGLSYARGNLVFLIDCDLEEEPELLHSFLTRLEVENCDVVYGVQEGRRGRNLERITGAAYFWLIDVLSDRPLPRNLVTARLMRHAYVRALVRHRDRDFVISYLWQTTGFKQIAVTVRKHSLSITTYSFKKKLSIAVKHITTSSTKLLNLVLMLGLGISGLAALVIIYLVSRYFLSGTGVDGWTSLIVSVWFFGGLTTLIMGVLGIYLATVLSETKRRPYTIVRKVHKRDRTGVLSERPAETTRTEVRPKVADAG